jgi:transcription termination factor Rho
MSVEPSTLERSALERKDREELTTIAQALGAKPPSRARKAEIVQLILELTGVESSAAASDGEPTAAAAPAAPARRRAPDGGDKEATVDDDGDTGAPATEAAAASEPDTVPEPGAAPEADTAPAAGPTASGRIAEAEAAPEAASGSEAPADDDDGQPEPPSEWELEFGGTTDVVDPPATDARGTGRNSAGNGTTRAASGDAKSGGGRTATRSRDGQGNGGDRADGAKQASSGTRSAARQGDDKADAKSDVKSDTKSDAKPTQGERDSGAQGGGQQGDNQGGGNQGQGDQAKGDVDPNEPGNRRRRRRGRRGKEEQTHVEEFSGEPVEVEGLLDLRDEGYGFLRVKGSLPSKDDIYVSVKQARQFGLRKGDHITGASRPAMRNEKNPALLRIDKVSGVDPEQARKRRRFEDLTPLFPDEKLALETADDASNMTARIVDIIAPVGKGQRGLIVSPPKAGKTAIVKQIARSVETNNPEVKLMVLLVDERPEEVTDMRRWLRNDSSEVIASTFDRPSDEHTQVAELTIERAKRLVEDGRDVCIILDGITRLARAYNLAAPATGRIMSGGVDSGALYPPKRFFGAARNIEEGGSLTILATALIETGSKMDEVIFEEFKGTGNMELRLDRRLAERRIYPAIDVDASSTRHEELLFARNQLNLVWALRRVLSGLSSTDGGNAAALELLIDRMKTFRTNDEFLAEVAKNRLAAG